MRWLITDQLAAANEQREFSVATLCNALGARKETVNDYIDDSFQAWHCAPPWCSGHLPVAQLSVEARSRRREASFFMVILAALRHCALVRTAIASDLGADPVALGHLLENFVLIELEKSLPYLSKALAALSLETKYTVKSMSSQEAPGRVLALFEMKVRANGTVG